MSSTKIFNMIAPTNVGRSVFDLSYTRKFTCDMGKLIPILAEEVVPGDRFMIGNQIVIRMQPSLAPIMHEVNVYVHYFFVPIRIIWDDWESFITGGEDGTDAPALPTNGGAFSAGTLADYLGMPIGIALPAGFQPVKFPWYAYNAIYNEYYRAIDFIPEVALATNDVQNRAWEKDYFCSALAEMQRGVAPSFPLSGVIDVESNDSDVKAYNSVDAAIKTIWTTTAPTVVPSTAPSGTGSLRWSGSDTGMEVDISGASTFDIADLRLAFQQQKFLERNNRAGSRYTEQLKAHYGVSPRDDRLDRPEYITGTKQPLIISEVLSTNDDGGANVNLGDMGGHGISVASNIAGKYSVKEHGIIMGIMSVMPRTAYSQGVDRQWLKTTKYDYYFPEFAQLSEQPVYEGELYASATLSEDQTIFGYQMRHAEYRYKKDVICGDMRSNYDHWHLGIQFSGRPSLDQTFLEADAGTNLRKDFLVAPGEDALIVNFGNIIKAVRPMPIIGTPGGV